MSNSELQMHSKVTHPTRADLIGEVIFINGAAEIRVAWPGDESLSLDRRPRYAASELTVVGQLE